MTKKSENKTVFSQQPKENRAFSIRGDDSQDLNLQIENLTNICDFRSLEGNIFTFYSNLCVFKLNFCVGHFRGKRDKYNMVSYEEKRQAVELARQIGPKDASLKCNVALK